MTTARTGTSCSLTAAASWSTTQAEAREGRARPLDQPPGRLRLAAALGPVVDEQDPGPATEPGGTDAQQVQRCSR